MRIVNRAASSSAAPSTTSFRASWARDLVHPLPLAAVAVLAVNDHLLKGSGLLPGWVTGKLSDVAGLFFFPLLLAAIARGAARLVLGRDIRDKSALAASAAAVTGVGFAAVKLVPPVNALVAQVWGVMWMDATDLWACLMLPLSAAFMLRREAHAASRASSTSSAGPSPSRRALDFAAVFATALASAATSKAPPPAAPPQPVATAVPVAEPVAVIAAPSDECASISLSVCERSASATFVVVEVRGLGPGSCQVDIEQAAEIAENGADTMAERVPARSVVKEGDTSTFSLSFLRPVAPEEQTAPVGVRLGVRRGHDAVGVTNEVIELSRACAVR